MKGINAQKIKELRMRSGLSQQKLAKLVGVSDKAISKWERGESVPDVLILCQLAELFEDDAAMLAGPIPRVLQELLTSKVALANTLLGEFLNYFCLGGD